MVNSTKTIDYQCKLALEIENNRPNTELDRSGVGFGYLVNGRVWKTTGSYYAVDAMQDVFPMVSYKEDNGEGYRKATQGLLDVSKFIGEKL